MYTLIGKTGSVACVGQHSNWRTSITLCLIAMHIAPFELVMPVYLSVLVQYQTLLPSVKQTVVAFVRSRGLSLGANNELA